MRGKPSSGKACWTSTPNVTTIGSDTPWEAAKSNFHNKTDLGKQVGFYKCIHKQILSQIGIWRGCPRRQFVLGAVRFVTALTRSVSLLRSS